MGCLVMRQYYLHIIEGRIGGNPCKLFYETREEEFCKEEQRIYSFSHEFSQDEDVVAFGAVTSNLPILAQEIAALIVKLIRDNIYFQENQYLEGFENVIEILIRTFNSSPQGQFDILSFIPFYKILKNTYASNVSIQFTLKLKDRMYFSREIGTKNFGRIVFPPAKYVVFSTKGKQFGFTPADKKQIDEVTPLNACVFELRPEIASNISGLILTDSLNLNKFNMKMSLSNNVRKGMEKNTNMLKVDFSNKQKTKDKLKMSIDEQHFFDTQKQVNDLID